MIEAKGIRFGGALLLVTLSLVTRPAAGASDLVVASGNGLAISLSREGVVSRVEVGGRRVDGDKIGGFFAGLGLIEEAARATASPGADGVHVALTWPALKLDGSAVVTGDATCIRVRGELHDTSGLERAVTVSFEVPFGPSRATTWWDDIDRRRAAGGSTLLENVIPTPAGATGTHSPYPLACVTGAAGVGMGIPLDRPVLHRFAYSPATSRLAVSFDFALTPTAAASPSRASFDVVVFPVDRVWGFRSALERYYTTYPADFERRVQRIGGWVLEGNLKTVPAFADFGFRYHWEPGSLAAVAFDNANGVYAFDYTDWARFFADIGSFPEKPDPEAVRGVFQQLFESPDPSTVVLSRPATAAGRIRFEILERQLGTAAARDWLQRAVAAVRRSATTGPSGDYNVGYLLNRKDWGPRDWWTGRIFCDVDPAVVGGYGAFLISDLLDRVFPEAQKKGAAYNGVALDNYFVDADTLDFRREHIAASDVSLTFSHEGLHPVVLGDFAAYEWASELARRLTAQGAFLMANEVGAKYPFVASLLDIHGYEWHLMDVANLARALAYHKPVVSLPVTDDCYLEPFVRRHVRFGFLPGGYPNQRFETDPALRALYEKYMPALIACATAGWEPVTEVTSDNPWIKVERFGRPGAAMFLSITNATASPQAGSLRLDSRALGVGQAVTTPDLLGGPPIAWTRSGDALLARVRLVPDAAVVVEIAR